MAARTILQTNTLEEFRVQFNALSSQDFGDIGTLDSSISATSIVGAMNELVSIVGANEGFFIEDETSSQQLIGAGQRLKVFGTSNQTTAVVSASDTLTFGLAPDLNITSITTSGATSTLGTIEISGNEIRSTDSSIIKVNDSLEVSNTLKTNTIETASGSNINFGSSNLITSGFLYTSNSSGGIIFEGATADEFETFVTNTDPTADRTITLPDATGTVALTGSTAYATSSIFTSSVSLAILDSSGSVLKTIHGSAT